MNRTPFLTPRGVKLLDFGLPLPLDLDDQEYRLTMPGTIIGTPRYLSPKQVMGEPADHKVDVFAVPVGKTGRISGFRQPALDRALIVARMRRKAVAQPCFRSIHCRGFGPRVGFKGCLTM